MKKFKHLIFLIVIALFGSVTLSAQEIANSKVVAPPVETHYMVSLMAHSAINPALSLEGEWKIDREWVLNAEFAGLYNMAGNFLDIDHPFMLHARVGARWYCNRDRRARLGRTIRKNSGMFLDFGLANLYGKSNHRDYNPIANPNGMTFYYKERNNIVGLYTALGFKIVSQSNIYFSGKIGIGLGTNITFGKEIQTEARGTAFPACDIKVGYTF